jgi:stalled ribosome rescue protein Dom34
MKQDQKKCCGVWIDGHKAIIVKFEAGNMQVGILESDMEDAYYHEGESIKGYFSGSHHNNREKTINERKHNIERKFIKNVFEEVQHSDELYVIGPGEMRIRLKHFIEEDHKNFADHIKGSASCDYLRESQIIARMKDFFNLK